MVGWSSARQAGSSGRGTPDNWPLSSPQNLRVDRPDVDASPSDGRRLPLVERSDRTVKPSGNADASGGTHDRAKRLERSCPDLSDGPHRPSTFGLEGWGQVWGIFVGGCVSGETTWSEMAGTDGHAHNTSDDEWLGWICIHSARAALTPKGKPSQLLLHELAHILVPNQGHTDRWRTMLTALGGKREAAKYLPKSRLSSETLWISNSPSNSLAATPSSSTEARTISSPSDNSPE